VRHQFCKPFCDESACRHGKNVNSGGRILKHAPYIKITLLDSELAAHARKFSAFELAALLTILFL
jgi:hypothetical protein